MKHKNLINFFPFCSCYICNKSEPSKTFAGFWDLQKHLSTHPDSQSHQCAINSSYIKSEKINELPIKNGKFVCSICGKRCKTGNSLTQHQMTHVDRKLTEVQCKICFKWMKNQNILRAHEVVHNESPMKCPHCDKVKFNERALKAHISQCHSTLKHQCTKCGKSFARTEKLKVWVFFL